MNIIKTEEKTIGKNEETTRGEMTPGKHIQSNMGRDRKIDYRRCTDRFTVQETID